MSILGHFTPAMTLRDTHLASDSIRTAYDTASAKPSHHSIRCLRE
jgi:hypothetical protein